MSTADSPFTLVTYQDVIDALGQDEDLSSDAKPAIESAISKAQLKLGSYLRSTLAAESVADIFYLDQRTAGMPIGGLFRFMLTNGLVRRDTVPSIFTCIDSPFGPWMPVDFATIMFDYDRGVLQVPSSTLDQTTYLKTSYNSGFIPADEGAIPEEIKQALLAYVPGLLMSAKTTEVNLKQQRQEIGKITTLDSIAEDMLIRYLRRVGAVIHPVSSERVPYVPA